MGKVKSVRLNERTERMFSIIKGYYERRNSKITDTEIIANGIELLYDDISKELNAVFVEKMEEALKEYPEAKGIFTKVYKNLEIPCIMNGDIMQDEFWGFFVVNEEAGSFYDVNYETGERTLLNRQFEKIYNIVCEDFANSESFQENMEILHATFFELFGNVYGRNK